MLLPRSACKVSVPAIICSANSADSRAAIIQSQNRNASAALWARRHGDRRLSEGIVACKRMRM